MSRTVNGEWLFDDEAKGVFASHMWKVADFCGLQVLSFCVMSNHFHILVRVPDGSSVQVGDQELMRRYEVLHPGDTPGDRARLLTYETIFREGGDEAEQLRRFLLSRMHDVSWFMRLLKQRFSIWFNSNHRRFGTLWAERYKSVLVEGRRNALLATALYIELNPVRAGMVSHPKNYPHCSCAYSSRGDERANAGILSTTKGYLKDGAGVTEALQFYLKQIGKGSLGSSERAALKRRLEKGDASVALTDLVMVKNRMFTDSEVFGSEAFILKFYSKAVQIPFNSNEVSDLRMAHRLNGGIVD